MAFFLLKTSARSWYGIGMVSNSTSRASETLEHVTDLAMRKLVTGQTPLKYFLFIPRNEGHGKGAK